MAEFTGNDLTGTSWRFLRENAPSRDLNAPATFRLEIASCSSVFNFGSYKIENYNISYSYGGVVSNGYVWFGGTSSSTYGYFRVGTSLDFAPLSAPTNEYSTNNAAIECTVTIGGGTDATNEQVVSWFKRNGEYLVEGYSITYHPDGGTPIPENLTEQTNLPTPLPTVSKIGYTFDGWFYDSSFTLLATAGDALTDNVNLYAKFTLVPIPDTTYDLSTYDWSIGSHSLTFVSQATGYRDADPSSPALTFTVYGVNLTATNGTLSPAITKIAPWETKTVTLTADTGYSVPASVENPPDGVTYTKTSSSTATIVIDGSLVEDTVTLPLVCVNKLATPTGVEATGTVVSFNPVENAESYYVYADGDQIGTFAPSGPTPTMPSKGDLIEMDLAGDPVSGVTLGTTYRVLNVNGTVAEVLAMTNASDSLAFGSGSTYAGSTLDNYLTTNVYNALNATAKAALVPKTFRQDSWYWDNSGDPDYSGYYGNTKPGTTAYTVSLGSTTFGEEISRSVYALSMQDVIDYVKDTTLGDGELQNYNIWKMFWNDEVSHDTGSWLRSAHANLPGRAWFVSGGSGFLTYRSVDNKIAVCPAFQIDLSKITWTPSN